MADRRGPGAGGRGQLYDAAMRTLVELDPALLFRVFGRPEPAVAEIVPASFPSSTLTVDLLLRTGPRELAHIEYQKVGEPDFVSRMLVYRGLIQRAHPRHRLHQHVLVLKDRPITGHDDYDAHGFTLELHIAYLREMDPEPLLAEEGLAPLAVLARGSDAERTSALVRNVLMFRDKNDRGSVERLKVALTLATIRLDDRTIEESVKESTMAMDIADEILLRVAERRDRARLLAAVLRRRFGDKPEVPEVADRLAYWPEDDAADAVLTATSLEDVPELPEHKQEG